MIPPTLLCCEYVLKQKTSRLKVNYNVRAFEINVTFLIKNVQFVISIRFRSIWSNNVKLVGR